MTDHEHTPPTEAELEMWGHDFGYTSAMNVLVREVRRLRAERSADSERLDWLESRTHDMSIGCEGRPLRDCIDAARQEPTP